MITTTAIVTTTTIAKDTPVATGVIFALSSLTWAYSVRKKKTLQSIFIFNRINMIWNISQSCMIVKERPDNLHHYNYEFNYDFNFILNTHMLGK